MSEDSSDDRTNISRLWAGSHVVLAVALFGTSYLKSETLAFNLALLVFLALAFEYYFGPIQVMRINLAGD